MRAKNTDSTPSKRRKFIKNEEDSADESFENVTPTEAFKAICHFFTPIHIISVWKEPGTTNNRISLAILLPSGVTVGNFSYRVLEGGREFELTVRWPDPMVDLDMMHKKWLTEDGPGRMEKYHPKYIGFEHALKVFRSRSSDRVESLARIALPFAVQTHIECRNNLGWREDRSRMLYVDLKAYEQQYAEIKDENSFELF